jgi:hypothetical protein
MIAEIRNVENGWIVGAYEYFVDEQSEGLNKLYPRGLPWSEHIFFDFKKALDYVEELKEWDE